LKPRSRVLADLTKYDYVGAFGVLTSAMTGAALVSIVASPLVMGGILKVISGNDSSGGVMRRFFGGGGDCFWRFFRLMILGGGCAVAVGAVLTVSLATIEAPLVEHGSETASYVWLGVDAIIVAAACGLFLLALDYARIQVVIDDSRGMVRAYVRALWFVVRQAVPAYGMAIAILVPAGVLSLVYVGYETMSPVASSWGGILALFVIQQTIIVTRVGLRVSLVDAEFQFARRTGERARLVASDPVRAAKTDPDAGTCAARPTEPDVSV
jgi:hypothetical protein